MKMATLLILFTVFAKIFFAYNLGHASLDILSNHSSEHQAEFYSVEETSTHNTCPQLYLDSTFCFFTAYRLKGPYGLYRISFSLNHFKKQIAFYRSYSGLSPPIHTTIKLMS